MPNPDELLKNILSDVRVEVGDMFDQNFRNQAFFDKPWPKRSTPFGNNPLLIGRGSGKLRRSLRGSVRRLSVVFTSPMPYAAIHNSGGKIPVTPKMRKFFWRRYYETSGRMTKLKSGKVSGSKRNVKLSTEAQFYKNMALTKKTHINIPQRQFVGNHPKVKATVEQIATNHITNFLNDIANQLKK